MINTFLHTHKLKNNANIFMTVRKHFHDSFGCVCKTEHKCSKKYALAKSNKYKEVVLPLAVHRS